MELEIRSKPLLKSQMQFVVIHALPLLAFWTGTTGFDWFVCVFLYFFRMFFITGGYHRYFSHRTFKTSRVFQFFLAFMAQTSMQKGVLWWGAHHRVHHRTSDTPQDPHSMKHYGFWYSHIGWIVGEDYKETHFKLIQDFAKYPELLWLNKHHIVPPVIMAISVYLLGGYVNGGGIEAMVSTHGLSTLLIGFFFSSVFLYHGTFSINSIMHKFGKPRYKTGDESKNNLILALITLGEGWHNNHHYYMVSTRQGFYWWEIDITYYILKMLSWIGIVWDIKEVPSKVRESHKVEDEGSSVSKLNEQLSSSQQKEGEAA